MTFQSLGPIHRLDANNTYLHISLTWAEPAVVLGAKSVGFPRSEVIEAVKTQVNLYI